ncbi:MAG: efflux RND transporter periplasmic adaptor subunit [Chitinophagaceae bacterium]|nr:efflux RND transporter periplasmic adaptor subunit [Chitinophagaceae bacterium]
MKTKSLIIIIGIIAALALIKIIFLKGEDSSGQKGGKKGNQAINVSAVIARAEKTENKLFASGTVMANEEVALRPEVSGKLVAIYFKEGSLVQKGALLAKINDADLQAQLRKLQLQLKLGKEREARMKGLLAISGISQEEYDMVVNQSQTINADIDFTRAQISKTEVRAPFTGKIGLKQISQGGYISTADVIATIQQLDLLKIDFSIPERYASSVNVGNIISFSVENKEEKFDAEVFALEPKIDEQTRNITIRAVYKNDKSAIFPGAFAKIELTASQNDSSIMIPTEAVIPILKGKQVFIKKGGKATPILVETGLRNDTKIEIKTGLQVGDTVITSGIMSLKPDAAVNIIKINQ